MAETNKINKKKDKLISFMVEWFVRYLKHKDLIFKKILNIEIVEEKILLTLKDKEQVFIISSNIDFLELKNLESINNPSLVLLNSNQNFNWLIKNWSKLIGYRNLSFYFINPFSEPDNKWIIYPYTHHQITEKESLEIGLKSMFELVKPISNEEILKLI